MHVIQYTIKSRHSFEEATFRFGFIREVSKLLQFDLVKVHGVMAVAGGQLHVTIRQDDRAITRNMVQQPYQTMLVTYHHHHCELSLNALGSNASCETLFREMLRLDPDPDAANAEAPGNDA